MKCLLLSSKSDNTPLGIVQKKISRNKKKSNNREMLRTKLTEELGITHPIIQGGMQNVGIAEMASAVSNAGGLGILTALTQPTPQALRAEIARCRTMTNKPFGVNLTILPALIPADYDGYLQAICEEKVAVIEISGGAPTKKYMAQIRAAGIKVIHKSATLKHALKAQEAGVDFIEVAGYESSIAGRASDDDVGTWVLLAKATAVLTTPVIVSGASGSGRQLAAAIAMGAQGITMGTRFLATVECPIHRSIKEHLAKPQVNEFSTVLVLRSFANATRVFKNDVALKILEVEQQQQQQQQQHQQQGGKGGMGGFAAVAPYARGDRTRKMMFETGDWNDAMWSCGQSVGLVEDVPTCKELIERIVAEARDRLLVGAKAVVVQQNAFAKL